MAPAEEVNQLAFVIVSGRQADDLTQHLVQNGFYFTRIDSSGGILQEQTICLLIGFNLARMPVLTRLAEKYCQPYQEYIPAQINLAAGAPPFPMIEAQSGGALIYTLDVERFAQL
jgi:uncharacterized protein YaaQ